MESILATFSAFWTKRRQAEIERTTGVKQTKWRNTMKVLKCKLVCDLQRTFLPLF